MKQLRSILGKTQQQVAAMLGVHHGYIRLVESGAKPFTRDLAFRIHNCTGASLFRLGLRGKGKSRKGILELLSNGEVHCGRTRRSYTREDFDKHLQTVTGSETLEQMALDSAYLLLRMFTAADKPGVAGVGHRLRTLQRSLWRWMRDNNEKFRLGVSEINQLDV